jgi:hypothetical protein
MKMSRLNASLPWLGFLDAALSREIKSLFSEGDESVRSQIEQMLATNTERCERPAQEQRRAARGAEDPHVGRTRVRAAAMTADPSSRAASAAPRTDQSPHKPASSLRGARADTGRCFAPSFASKLRISLRVAARESRRLALRFPTEGTELALGALWTERHHYLRLAFFVVEFAGKVGSPARGELVTLGAAFLAAG